MKHLLTGVAVVAALAFATQVYAQSTNPSAGSPTEMSGPKASGTNYIPQHRHVRGHHAVHSRMAHGPKSLTDTTRGARPCGTRPSSGGWRCDAAISRDAALLDTAGPHAWWGRRSTNGLVQSFVDGSRA
jgi:hypothetical protein